ncbi:MAG: hypothetical protein AAGG07_06310 [Planctomycetota bacterium]
MTTEPEPSRYRSTVRFIGACVVLVTLILVAGQVASAWLDASTDRYKFEGRYVFDSWTGEVSRFVVESPEASQATH